MYKLFFLTLCLLLSIQPVSAQEPVILLSATGQVRYQSPEASRATVVLPGALLQPDGQLLVRNKGVATLQYRKSILQFDGRNLTRIRDLFEQETSAGNNTALARTFSQAVEDAFLLAYLHTNDNNKPWGTLHAQKSMGDGWAIAGSNDTRKDTISTVRSGDGWAIAGSNDTRKDTISTVRSGDGWGIAGSNDTRKDTISTVRSGDGWGIAGSNDTRKDTISTVRSGDGWGIAGSNDTRKDTISTVRSGDGWGIAGSNDTRNDTISTVRSGDGWGIAGSNDTRKDTISTVRSGDGWGIAAQQIKAIKPYGYLSYGTITFRWEDVNNKQLYIVEILNEDNRVLVKGSTNNTFISLNLNAGNLMEGERYRWRVRTPGSTARQSNELFISLQPTQVRAELESNVEQLDLYREATPDAKALILATAYEQAQWYDEAIAAYERAIQLQGKKGQSARLMYAAFWERWGDTSAAIQAFRMK
jgi:hypothetical protein